MPRETFIQFKQIDPGNFYTGMGAIQAAGRVIDTYNEGIDTQKVSMQNRGMKSGIFKPKSHLEKQQMDELRNRVRDMFWTKQQGVSQGYIMTFGLKHLKHLLS